MVCPHAPMWNRGIMLRHTSFGPKFQLDTMHPTPEKEREKSRKKERSREKKREVEKEREK